VAVNIYELHFTVHSGVTLVGVLRATAFLMDYLFGYGSLLSPESATRTLLRPVTMADLHPAYLHGFRRTWTAATEVIVTEGSTLGRHTALFLDLSIASDVTCNGIILAVAEDEWGRLDLRERMYQRMPVQVAENGEILRAFTYIVPTGEKKHEGVVLENYMEMLRQALRTYPDSFGREFWSSTAEPEVPLVRGNYVFRDNEQNRAAGRE
jgi:cation transport regulator ChaC